MSFCFTEEETQVLKNFAGINPSMLIQPTGIKVINDISSCVGLYPFKDAYDFEEFGIFEVPEMLSILSAYKLPQIKVDEKYITISEGSSKVRYFSTAKDLIPPVRDAKKKCDSLPAVMEFVFPQEKLVMLRKMASLLKADFVFFETTEDEKIRITVGDALESSNNTWHVVIDTDITANCATKPLQCKESELRIITSDYKVKLAEMGKAGISHWESAMGVEYFVALSAIKAN
jgi:hypothetical protein